MHMLIRLIRSLPVKRKFRFENMQMHIILTRAAVSRRVSISNRGAMC